MQQSLWQFCRFALVGGVAAVTHYAVLMLLLQSALWSLAYANVVAFALAFWVSYFGHRHFSFQAQAISHQQNLSRFVLVALLGFAFNESFLLLMAPIWSFSISGLVVLSIVLTAILSFILNRFFAFKP